MTSKKRICIVIGSRANYSSAKSVMQAVADHPELELQLVVGASAVLDRYGNVVDLIEREGFSPVARIHMLIEGETPATMAKSTGLGLIELAGVFRADPAGRGANRRRPLRDHGDDARRRLHEHPALRTPWAARFRAPSTRASATRSPSSRTSTSPRAATRTSAS